MSLGSGRCHYHPERAGLGICVECRNVICTECTTQFEGINRCAQCLAKRRQRAQGTVEQRDWTLGRVVLSLAAIAWTFGAVYAVTQWLHR